MHRKAISLARLKLAVVTSGRSVCIAGNPYFLIGLWRYDAEIVDAGRNLDVILTIHHHILRRRRRIGIGRNLILKVFEEVGRRIIIVPYRSGGGNDTAIEIVVGIE